MSQNADAALAAMTDDQLRQETLDACRCYFHYPRDPSNYARVLRASDECHRRGRADLILTATEAARHERDRAREQNRRNAAALARRAKEGGAP